MLCVKNGFLSFEEAPEAASMFRRTRSAEEEPSTPAPSSPARIQELDRLNRILSERVKVEPVTPQATESPKTSRSVTWGRKTSASMLRQVTSACSLSTMAPEDPDEAHGEGQYHYYYSTGLCFQHCNVPKSTNLAARFSKVREEEVPPTTMMIRNIPNRYSQRELITELEALGFGGSFDFFYAPIDSGTMGNVGYAFVNFLDADWAEHCRQTLTGYAFKRHQQKHRRKIATVSVAHLQGLKANLRHYENAAVNGRNRPKRCGPVVMTNVAQGPHFSG